MLEDGDQFTAFVPISQVMPGFVAGDNEYATDAVESDVGTASASTVSGKVALANAASAEDVFVVKLKEWLLS